jgi:hypothetical protein
MNKKIKLNISKALFLIFALFCAGISYADNYTTASELSSYDPKAVEVITSCRDFASDITQEKFKKYYSATEYKNNQNYKINDYITRFWYNTFLKTAKTAINNALTNNSMSMEKGAEIAYQTRHYARVFTRSHMKNDEGLSLIEERDTMVYGNLDGPSFDDLVRKNSEKQFAETHHGEEFDETISLDEKDMNNVYRKIIDSSCRSNESVNGAIMCYEYLPEAFCVRILNTWLDHSIHKSGHEDEL